MASELQKSRPTQKLFKYHIDRIIAEESQESQYFRRLNRFRYNSYNHTHGTPPIIQLSNGPASKVLSSSPLSSPLFGTSDTA